MDDIHVSLTSFADFSLRPDAMKPSLILELKARTYAPFKDYWRIMREAIVELFQNQSNLDHLDTAINATYDDRKPNYISAKNGIKKFLSKNNVGEYFIPPKGIWSHQQLSINVNPELGLYVKGKPFIVKLYFKGKTSPPGVLLNSQRARTIGWVMQETFGEEYRNGISFAVLDVVKGIFIIPKPHDTTKIATYCCATNLINIWNAI